MLFWFFTTLQNLHCSRSLGDDDETKIKNIFILETSDYTLLLEGSMEQSNQTKADSNFPPFLDIF